MKEESTQQRRKEQDTTIALDKARKQFAELQETYKTVLPKVDPALINDLLARERITKEPLSYTIEVFTRKGIDTEAARNYIYQKTGKMPSIHDNGTHYVTTQEVSLEMLKEISDSDDVVDIRGSYCGGIGMQAAYFERRE